jgi:hypothetical protein
MWNEVEQEIKWTEKRGETAGEIPRTKWTDRDRADEGRDRATEANARGQSDEITALTLGAQAVNSTRSIIGAAVSFV